MWVLNNNLIIVNKRYDKYTRNQTLSIWLEIQFTQCYSHGEKDLFYFILDLDFYVILSEKNWPVQSK